jgi:phenylpropionate dioxygenase-like ring-hydroxylating dioxygenase large terminal subunit
MEDLNRETVQLIKQKMEEGLFPQWIVTDPEIYKLEIKKLFSRTWHFLGHESELKEPGDYVTRWIVHDPVLMVRSTDGKIKAFLNSCTHRGVRLCTADCGNKKTFTCPYHGWTFNLDGELIGITLGNKVYGEKMKKEEWGLKPIPRVESYRGLIFANLDPNAMPLKEYLAEMTWYLDILLGRTDKGMEVVGEPQRWVASGNWKITYENFTGDPYHVMTTHRSTIEVGITPDHSHEPERLAHQVVMSHGHGISVGTYKEKPSRPYQRTPKEMWPLFERNLSPEQNELLSRAFVFTGGIFPTFSFVSPMHGIEGELYNYLNFRVWRPLAPDKVEIWSWFLMDKEAPEDYKQKAYKGYIASFGPSGTLEQDDTVNWARIVEASKGYMVIDKTLSYNNLNNYLMGWDKVEPDDNFPGPGIAYAGFVDAVSSNIHKCWFELVFEDWLNA